MPIYEYECLTCGITFEKRQSFSDEPRADCPEGHSNTRRLIAAPAIVFKGSGFYVNDSRAKNSANGTGGADKGTDKSEKPAESKAETKAESKKEKN